MKKLLLIVGLVATTTLTYAQSNTPGKIQLGLGWGILLGGASIETESGGVDSEEDGVGGRANFGIRGQYGLSEKFSAGIYIRRESAAYVTTDDDFNSSESTLLTRGTGFGLEAKYYPVNKDKFALYLAPSIGFTTSKDVFESDGSSADIDAKSSGLGYGLNVGFNWWWAEFIGMSLDLGYQGIGLSGEVDDFPVEYKVKGGGVLFGLGLVTKFGGE